MQTDALELPERIVSPTQRGNAPVFAARVDSDAWRRAAQTLSSAHQPLISLWATVANAHEAVVSAAYELDDGLLWLQLPVAAEQGYPDLSALFPCATRMQRAIYDLTGVRAFGADDTRAWLDHGQWPARGFPLREQSGVAQDARPTGGAEYAFVSVAGDGVHEIAVGPIHAGVIEPGHFRFSVVGEKVLRLEQRLGYTHKGVERLFEQTPLRLGHRLAGRISGDATVAYTWAFCMALENACGTAIPPRAQWLRGVLLERERIANHLGDLGALGNDGGFAFGLAQFSRLKEDWVRVNEQLFGHRYLMDLIVPGGVSRDLDERQIAILLGQCDRCERQVQQLQRLYDEQSGLQDRFAGTGILTQDVARHFGVRGVVARASGQRRDVRVDHPHAPYDQVTVRAIGESKGDVAARVAVRFNEIGESIRIIRAILSDLPASPSLMPIGEETMPARGLGWVESWRGDVLVALETGANGTIARCHCHDPSWQNWPALEHAVIGNIVADFPLINKSFNLSYSGHDV
jgi:Ni,Fe-hydrogenase III large subunit/Ni,Fe-hydrogenase III component G